MNLTDQQIRDTVARMEAESAKAPLARNGGRKARLLELALAGDPNARFVVHSHFEQQQRGSQVGPRMAAWLARSGVSASEAK